MKAFITHLSLALALIVAGPVAAQTAKPTLNIAVFAAHYVFAGRAFDDLDRLESAVRALGPRSIGLDACGSGVTRPLMAAAHRLREFPLHLRTSEPDSPACASSAAPRSIDDAAVDRYWHSVSP